MLLFVAFFSGIEIAFINANRFGIELKEKAGKVKWNHHVEVYGATLTLCGHLPNRPQHIYGALWLAV